MKLNTIILVISAFGLVLGIHACPTCVSSLDDQKPPFFSEEFYQPKKQPVVVKQEVTEGEAHEEQDSTSSDFTGQ